MGLTKITMTTVTLKPWQEDAVQWLAARNWRGLLALATGTGKTFTALEAARRSGSTSVLVLTTKSTVAQWEAEATRYGVPVTVLNYEKLLDDALMRRLVATSWDMVIADECERIKNPAAKTVKRFKKIPARYRVPMSATPNPNSIHELYSCHDWLYPGALAPNFMTFRARFCVTNPYIPAQIIGYRDKEKLEETFRAAMFVVKDDVLGLPNTIRDVRWLDLAPVERVTYEKMKAEGIAKFAGGLDATIPNLLVEITRLMQFVNAQHLFAFVPRESTKEVALRAVLDSSDKKTIVFATLAETVKHLHSAYPGSVMLIGEMSSGARQDALARFKDDHACRVIFMSDAGAHGINMQHAKRVIHYSLPPHDARLRQRLGRARRMGQTDAVEEIFLIARGTVEEKLWNVIAKKRKMEEALTRGDYRQMLDL